MHKTTLPPAIAEKIRWNSDGLITAIAQCATTRQVLMLAWVNAEALAHTIKTGEAHYYSRSRKKQWKKGEESGHIQRVKSLALDCDGDAILMFVEQTGVACHTGRAHCFFHELTGEGEAVHWQINLPVEKVESEMYGKR